MATGSSAEFYREAAALLTRHLLTMGEATVDNGEIVGTNLYGDMLPGYSNGHHGASSHYDLHNVTHGMHHHHEDHHRHDTLKAFLWPDVAATIFIPVACGIGMLFSIYQVGRPAVCV
eukprot:1929805-Pyramimonas_sp.AAC.2